MSKTPSPGGASWEFDDHYRVAADPAMLAVERAVCGCDYGSTSWTTQTQADRLVRLLGLSHGTRLLDVGAGAGWPALYLSKSSGCDVTLLDLPGEGLRMAAQRASQEAEIGGVAIAGADAAAMPFPDASFDAVSHSDALCCLAEKQAVISECRRVARDGARMVFSVVFIPPGIDEAQRRVALEGGPEFVEADESYSTMLERGGWALELREDLTAEFLAASRRTVAALDENAFGLDSLIGAEMRDEWRKHRAAAVEAIDAGWLRREQFAATAA